MKKPNIPEIEQYGIPDASQYDVIKYIGRGAWTPVFLLKRKTDGSLWAGKFLRPTEPAQKQKEDRGWTDDEYWTKEAQEGHIPLHQNIATGFVDRADNGERFYVEKYLGQKTERGYEERFLNNYLDQNHNIGLEELIHIARGMASALTLQHTKAGGKGRAHGDFNPKNIAYTLEGVIVLSDFGTTTIGDRRTGHVGSELTRAPESWSDSAVPAKSADVFSFGSTLYRMFTGKYLFQEELEGKFKDNPQAFIDYLKENKERWNSTIDEKLFVGKIPKPFWKLMQRCLYDPESRIKDGVELSKELEKNIKNYYKSRPMSRLRRYSAVGGILALLGMGLFYGNGTLDRFRTERDKHVKELEYEKKVRICKVFESEGYSSDFDENIRMAELRGWMEALRQDGIKDTNTMYAAYINPKLVYEAIRATGKTSYRDIEGYIVKRDVDLLEAILTIQGGSVDIISRSLARDQGAKVNKKWDEIKRDYEQKNNTNAPERLYDNQGKGGQNQGNMTWLPNPSLSR